MPLTDLDALINAVISREVGSTPYVNDPDDPGGETCWGITVAIARAYGYQGAMQDMPRQVAVDIYGQRFWFGPRFSQVDAIAPAIAAKLFDIGVNLGQSIGVQFLQRALNALRREGDVQLYPAMRQDGAIGPITLAALSAFLKARGDGGRSVLLFLLRSQQAVRYMERTEANPTMLKYAFGWEQARAML